MTALLSLEGAEWLARAAREGFSRLEGEASAARENGMRLPPGFWECFGNAWTTVQLAEREVNKARERERK